MSKDKGGVWRTVNGAHVFIENGQTPEEAFAYHKKIHAMNADELKKFCTENSSRKKSKLVQISLNFFGEEKELKNQTSISLQKGIRTLNKRISEHERKINSPYELSYWDKLTPSRKKGLIVRWKKEIVSFRYGITLRKEELRKRGEKYD